MSRLNWCQVQKMGRGSSSSVLCLHAESVRCPFRLNAVFVELQLAPAEVAPLSTAEWDEANYPIKLLGQCLFAHLVVTLTCQSGEAVRNIWTRRHGSRSSCADADRKAWLEG